MGSFAPVTSRGLPAQATVCDLEPLLMTAQVAESVVQERMATYLTPSPQRLYRVLMIARDNANVQLMTWGSCKR